MAATQVRDEILSAGGSSDGTVPPGESVPVGVHAPMDNGRRGIYDNPRYHMYHPYSAPLPTTTPPTSASATRVTGISLDLLARPPPPPPQTQTPTAASSSASNQPRQAAVQDNRYHPYATSGANPRTIPSTTAPAPPLPRNDSYQDRFSGHSTDRVSRTPAPSQPRQSHFSSTGHGHGHGFDEIRPSQATLHLQPGVESLDRDPHGLVLPRMVGSSSGAGMVPKPHPLQHLVDIHNAGPVSAFSQDPSNFTGENLIYIYCVLTSLRGILRAGALLLARGSVECELPPSRGWLPPAFF